MYENLINYIFRNDDINREYFIESVKGGIIKNDYDMFYHIAINSYFHDIFAKAAIYGNFHHGFKPFYLNILHYYPEKSYGANANLLINGFKPLISMLSGNYDDFRKYFEKNFYKSVTDMLDEFRRTGPHWKTGTVMMVATNKVVDDVVFIYK